MSLKNTKKVIFFILINFLLSSGFLFCNTENSSSSKKIDFSTLLENYKKNNRDYQILELQLQQATNSYKETLIESGINLSFSSGRMGAEFADSSTKINLSPEVNVSSSKLNNTSLSMNLPLDFDISKEGEFSSEIQGASLMLSTDIFSDISKQKKITLEKANRKVIESQRSLKKGEIKIYSSFLQELRSLYSSALAVTQAENSLIEKQLDFDTIKAKGYATSSAKYRTANLEVESAKRTVKEKERLYNSALAIFASKCSVKVNQLDLSFVIPEVELLSIRSFSKEDFESLEKAKWNYHINSETRKLNTDFSLSAQAGYGFSIQDDSYLDSAQAGLTMKMKGLSVSATTAIPINQNSNPSISLGIGWNPSTSKLDNLSYQNNEIQDKIEKLEIQDAEENFFDTVLKMNETYNNLEWETAQNLEQFNLYQELENDMKNWYSKGIISESEYRQSKINLENAKVKLAITKIDRIIYNNDLSMLFVETQGEANEN